MNNENLETVLNKMKQRDDEMKKRILRKIHLALLYPTAVLIVVIGAGSISVLLLLKSWMR